MFWWLNAHLKPNLYYAFTGKVHAKQKPGVTVHYQKTSLISSFSFAAANKFLLAFAIKKTARKVTKQRNIHNIVRKEDNAKVFELPDRWCGMSMRRFMGQRARNIVICFGKSQGVEKLSWRFRGFR